MKVSKAIERYIMSIKSFVSIVSTEDIENAIMPLGFSRAEVDGGISQVASHSIITTIQQVDISGRSQNIYKIN